LPTRSVTFLQVNEDKYVVSPSSGPPVSIDISNGRLEGQARSLQPLRRGLHFFCPRDAPLSRSDPGDSPTSPQLQCSLCPPVSRQATPLDETEDLLPEPFQYRDGVPPSFPLGLIALISAGDPLGVPAPPLICGEPFFTVLPNSRLFLYDPPEIAGFSLV